MDDLIQQGVNALKSGDRETARKLLASAIEQNPDNEHAWEWMYNVCNTDQERNQCLKQILRINPKNDRANQLLNQSTGFDFPLQPLTPSTPPAPSTPSISTSQAKTIDKVSVQFGGLDNISLIIIVILIILGLFWIAIGLIQIAVAFSLEVSDAIGVICTGGLNILISIVNLLGIMDVRKRSKRVPTEMMFLAVVGSLFGAYQMLVDGALIQVCAIPLYIVLGILAYINKDVYKN